MNFNDDSSYDSNFTFVDVSSILTPEYLLYKGLEFVGFTERRVEKACIKTNTERFKNAYGASHIVCAQIWEDLQTTCFEDLLPVPKDMLNEEYFLMALYFLKKYPTEMDRESKFNYSHATIAKWTWYYLERIQALKHTKIVWDEGKQDDIWILTVDGTHCWINEPKHPTLSQDRGYYSHKFNKAGINYELGISLSKNQLVWMSGPHRAGASDKTVFILPGGLQDKLKASNKRAIGDRGYEGYDEISIPNAHDEKMVGLFKSRALKRHENFNGMTKTFKCLDSRFRHSIKKFGVCFESICVICQCQLENGSPLYDSLTPSMVETYAAE